jgi:hypothetical protein
MDAGFLTRRLLTPLAVGGTLCFALSFALAEPWRGLLVNLAATAAGTIMTVFYVDTILARRERQQWAEVRERAARRAQRLANMAITSIRTSLGVGIEVFDASRPKQQQMARVAEQIVARDFDDSIRRMDEQKWRSLVANLRTVSGESDRVLMLFPQWLDAPLVRQILDLQARTDELISLWELVPDVLGVPPERLPAKIDGSSSADAQTELNVDAVCSARGVLQGAAQLLRALDAH